MLGSLGGRKAQQERSSSAVCLFFHVCMKRFFGGRWRELNKWGAAAASCALHLIAPRNWEWWLFVPELGENLVNVSSQSLSSSVPSRPGATVVERSQLQSMRAAEENMPFGRTDWEPSASPQQRFCSYQKIPFRKDAPSSTNLFDTYVLCSPQVKLLIACFFFVRHFYRTC